MRSVVALIAVVFVVMGLAGCTNLGPNSVEVPKDFPAAVQLPKGTVMAADKTGAAWTVTMKLDEKDSRQKALDNLTSEGFSIIGETGSTANDRAYSLASKNYSVRVGVTTVDEHDVLNYTVAERQDGDR